MNASFFLIIAAAFVLEMTPLSEDYSIFQNGLFLDLVLISPRTEKALAAAVIKLMAPMARVACGDRQVMENLCIFGKVIIF